MRTVMVRGGQLAVLAGATVGAWWVWLGSDDTYQNDLGTGAASGPFQWWQVAGVVITLGMLAFGGGRLLHPLLVVPTMAVAFTVACSVPEAAADPSGLWAVGALLVAIGTALGATLVSVPIWYLRHGRRVRSVARA